MEKIPVPETSEAIVTPEEKEKIIEGIKHRLSNYSIVAITLLNRHLKNIAVRLEGNSPSTVNENWNEIFALSGEGTKEGRTVIGEGAIPGTKTTTKIANRTDVAPESLARDLIFIVNHDDPTADTKITVSELSDVLEEVIEDFSA